MTQRRYRLLVAALFACTTSTLATRANAHGQEIVPEFNAFIKLSAIAHGCPALPGSHDPGQLRAGQLDRSGAARATNCSSFTFTGRARENRRQGGCDGGPSGTQELRLKLAVVAVLLDRGGASELVEAPWKNIPKEKEKESVAAKVTIDAAKLLPENKGYYSRGATPMLLQSRWPTRRRG
jgi:hypothetical protein